MKKKDKVIAGITATGQLTLGNYLGSIKNLVALQKEYDVFAFVADLHALTNYIDPYILKENKINIFALYLACGLDPQQTTLFFQSDIAAHSELNWIITTITNIGELSRMTQFKDKSKNHLKQQNGTEIIPTGLFVYPALMIADILLYNAKYVAVGADQKQHLELAKKIIKRMNKKYHLNFLEPIGIIPKIGAKIKSLQNPENKMSKSDTNTNASIYLLDNPQVAYNKIQKAVTDSENKIYFSENKPGVANLLTIYCCLKEISMSVAEAHFKDLTYRDLKHEVGQVVAIFLTSIQQKYHQIIQNIDQIITQGKNKAEPIAQANILKIKKAFGLK